MNAFNSTQCVPGRLPYSLKVWRMINFCGQEFIYKTKKIVQRRVLQWVLTFDNSQKFIFSQFSGHMVIRNVYN